eukprot:GHUV01000089.1.p1 GENE.GHUV01000089.1~~GHUV01000089.1.p1  ORF type:complete len:401 (-),score=-68.20 GHUV01000089.1:1831-3033(-)
MNILEIENFFGNSSFFFLFISMISYWIGLIFNLKFFGFGRLSMICANFSLLSLFILRWKESGHFPLSNLYESLMFLSWSFSTFHLILENVEFSQENISKNLFSIGQQMNQNLTSFVVADNSKKQDFVKQPKNSFLGQPALWLTSLTSPPALFTNAFATFSLPNEMQHSASLVPALQSNWLMMHVTVMILSYSALICGSLLSIAFLIFSQNLDMNFLSKKNISFTKLMNSPSNVSQQDEFLTSVAYSSLKAEFTSVENVISLENSLSTKDLFIDEIQKSKNIDESREDRQVISTKQKFAEKLDNLSYRILGIGFPLLTIGILSGAVWANEAWGSYWSWDPKETWALATWFVFAIYLHTRLTKGWSGKKPAIIASLGFVTVWICFLGVNLLGEGLHSYGFFK